MGYFAGTWGVADLNAGSSMGFLTKSSYPSSYGKWRLIEGPQAFYWGGRALVVSKTCDNADLATDLIRRLTTNETIMTAIGTDCPEIFVNNKTVNQKISTKNELLGGQDTIKIFHDLAQKLTVLPPSSEYDREIRSSFFWTIDLYSLNYRKGYETVDGAIAEFYYSVQDLDGIHGWDSYIEPQS
jgi:hypothetical protein